MSLEEIGARTTARKAAGADQSYPQHAIRSLSTAALPARMVGCVDLGERLAGQPCGSPLVRCNRFGDVTARFRECSRAQRCCATCPEYRTADPPTEPAAGATQSE